MAENGTITSRLSLFELAEQQVRAIQAGDVSRAHECAGAAQPWVLYTFELHVDHEKTVGVMLTNPDKSSARHLPPPGMTPDNPGERFVPMDPLAALELCGEDDVTPEAVQRVIDTLDRLGEWDALTKVFEWLVEPRTELCTGLDDRPDAEIVALAPAAFQHWKPYYAPRRANDETFVRYLNAVGEANRAWLAERQEQARQAIETAKVERDKQALRDEIRDEIRGEVVREHRAQIRAEARAELRADEDLRGEIRDELMQMVDPEPGAFETMLQWLDAQIAGDEGRSRSGTVDTHGAFLARLNCFRIVRAVLLAEQPGVEASAAKVRDLIAVTLGGWWAVNEYRDGKRIRTISTHRDRIDADVACDRARSDGNANVLVEPVEKAARPTEPHDGTGGTAQDTGRLVDVIRDIDHCLADLDEIAGDLGQTALDVLRMAGEEEPHDARAKGLDAQLLTLCRLAVERWSK